MTRALPSGDSLLQAVVECLKVNKGPVHIDIIEKYVREKLEISSEVAGIIRQGKRTELAYKLAWARSKAKSAGLISSPRHSFWEIS